MTEPTAPAVVLGAGAAATALAGFGQFDLWGTCAAAVFGLFGAMYMIGRESGLSIFKYCSTLVGAAVFAVAFEQLVSYYISTLVTGAPLAFIRTAVSFWLGASARRAIPAMVDAVPGLINAVATRWSNRG